MTKKLFLNHKTFWSGTILLFLLYIPFFFFGENSIIIGFDNVDCDLIYKHLLKQSKHLFFALIHHTKYQLFFQNLSLRIFTQPLISIISFTFFPHILGIYFE